MQLIDDGVLGAVRALTPAIRAQCTDLDRTRSLPGAVVEALRSVGAFRLLSPRDLGGLEIDPVTFIRVVEEAAFAEGSVGWCTMIGGGYSQFAGILPPGGALEIFADPRTVVAGTFRPFGTARRTGDGYRVSGRWPLASGSSHATWFEGGCTILEGDVPVIGPSGRPIAREIFFPASDVEVIDTWESTGLRGTASHDFAVADVLVPEERTCWFTDAPSAGGALYRMPAIGVFAGGIGAVPLGIARRAREEFVAMAQSKKQYSSSATLAESPVVQAKLGRADTLVRAAMSHLVMTFEDVWAKVSAGHSPTLGDHGALWLAATFAAQSAIEAIETLYAAAGSSSVYANSALDLCLRDARTAAQHICTQDSNLEHFGRAMLVRNGTPGPWIMDYRGD